MPAARLAIAWLINVLALWIANVLWDGVSIHGFWAYAIGSAVLGIANAVIKPMVAIAEWIAPNFSIDGFWSYVGTVFVVWAVNWLAHAALESQQRRPSGRFAT